MSMNVSNAISRIWFSLFITGCCSASLITCDFLGYLGLALLLFSICMPIGHRYYQIVRCFRDEDLRADRQPEFTQIDCEMAFVEQEDILNTFEGLLAHVLKGVHNHDMAVVPRMTYAETMRDYGNDKPDIRFDMKLKDMRHLVKDAGFVVFDKAELVVGICVDGCANYTRKQLDKLTDWVKRPQIGMTGMIWMKVGDEGSCSSSVNKFFDADALNHWKDAFGAKPGDLILVLAGKEALTRKAMSELRLHMAETLGLRNPSEFAPLWVLDFPLLEWDEESGRYHAMHHPFTSPKPEDMHLIDSDPGAVRANAYDLVLNGNEIGGGSIRNHDRAVQARMFDLLGFSPEETGHERVQFAFGQVWTSSRLRARTEIPRVKHAQNLGELFC
jgi:aspartyl-tRNA synthetase